jgi:hypothetical protein
VDGSIDTFRWIGNREKKIRDNGVLSDFVVIHR